MKSLLRPLILGLSALALYRLWPARGFLWWALLASAILMAWTTVTLRTAVRDRASADLARAINPRLAGQGSDDESTQVVRSRLAVNVVTAITLALSMWAIVVAS